MIWIMPMHFTNLAPWSSYWQRVWYSCFHILHESWTFILVVSLCPACGTPNNFSFLFFLILVKLKCEVLQILLLAPLLLDLSFDIGSLPVVRLPIEPLPEFGTSVVLKGISNVVIVSSQISAYVACQSLHTSTYP
jgi:hypothetical protein